MSVNVEPVKYKEKEKPFMEYWKTNTDATMYCGFECLKERYAFMLGNCTDFTGFPACFTGETLVETHFGPRPISEIKEGDLVWSFNHEQREPELRRVEKVFNHGITQDRLIKITMKDGTVIRVTENHEFFNGTEYVKIKTLLGI